VSETPLEPVCETLTDSDSCARRQARSLKENRLIFFNEEFKVR
jgi:hypothetical protein